MNSDNKNTSSRNVFLKTTTLGATALAAGLIQKSAGAAETNQNEATHAPKNPSTNEMDLLFLGTGAADWSSQYPPIDKPLARGEFRGMCSMLINGHILIDCGPTVLDVMNRYNVNPADTTDILLTHTHGDHFQPKTILAIAEARDEKLGPLKFWAHPEALKRVPTSNRIEKCPVEIGKTFKVHGVEMTGLEANHLVRSSTEKCLYYLLESPTKTVLYATDGSWLLPTTWNYLQQKKLDVIIWDATIGEGAGDYRIFSHNDLSMIRHMNQTLKEKKVINPNTKIILTHMARTLHPPHEQMEKELLEEGLIPAYDGMPVALN